MLVVKLVRSRPHPGEYTLWSTTKKQLINSMAKEKKLLKAIPENEIQQVTQVAKSGKTFWITFNPTKGRFTLWRKVGNEYERLSTAANPLDFDEEIEHY